MLTWAVAAVVLVTVIYWFMRARRSGGAGAGLPAWPVVILILAALSLIVWSAYLNRPEYSYSSGGQATAIAIAFDLSPSMLAIPDPATYPDYPARFERAKSTLFDLFRALEDRQANILVSMIGFTRTAEVIMGWESNTAQIRDMLQYAVSPDLFTSSGTNLEAAADSLLDVYSTLPEPHRENTRKIAILVSDGEDTSRQSSVDYALEKLRSAPFEIVALQTGLLGTDEGVPRYGEVGDFQGFERMGGRVYTVPDTDSMNRIASASSPQGLYARAEDPDSVQEILAFIDNRGRHVTGPGEKMGVILGLFVVTLLLYARLLL